MPQTTQQSRCTIAQHRAAQIGAAFEGASNVTGMLALGSAAGTAISGAGEGVTFGLDTPVTVTFGSMTTFFGAASFGSGAAASALNSFARGNGTAMRDFNWTQLTNLAATVAAGKIPGVKNWAEVIGDLAEQAADLAVTGGEACQ